MLEFVLDIVPRQCDQIGPFITLCATFQSPCQQLFCPNCKHISKSFILLAKSFMGNFYRHLATFYWSHYPQDAFFQSERNDAVAGPRLSGSKKSLNQRFCQFK